MPEDTNYAIIAAARNLLKDTDPSPFTRSGLDRFHIRVERFIEDLLLESISCARRQRLRTVEAVHVDLAADVVYLRRKRKIYSLVGTVGGILLGVALTLMVDAPPGKASVSRDHLVAGISMAAIGGVFMTLQFRRE